MHILGVNMGLTQNGKSALKDGGACLLKDGDIIAAVSEERLTRIPHAGGFTLSVAYCLEAAKIDINNVDLIVVSSCCEEPLTEDFEFGESVTDRSRIRTIQSHHLSHAYSAFATSPFDEAIIMVLDNEGNIVGPQVETDFWRNRLERNSYYIGRGISITPLAQADDDLGPDEIGPGEAYRYFTYYLGWPSYVHAGKTMGLASYGRREPFEPIELFTMQSGKLKCRLANRHDEPEAAIAELAHSHGIDLGPPRAPEQALTQRHNDIAYLIQDRLERALIEKVQYLSALTGVKNLCIAGGIGLNAVVNRKILDHTSVENLFVQPAAGDSGQCLGNALFGWLALLGKQRGHAMTTAYLGRRYEYLAIRSALAAYSSVIDHEHTADMPAKVARLIADGNVIGWFEGGSEFGPRALGHRSILADPRRPAMIDYLNVVVKHREPFRPFAPSVLAEDAQEYFDLPCPSPFMLLVAQVHPNKRHIIPAITHVDGSSRIQTVTQEENGRYYDLIRAFREVTGVSLILNTSFNLGGEAIVETPEHAIDCFLRSQIDYLVLEDFFVRRRNHRDTPGFVAWSQLH